MRNTIRCLIMLTFALSMSVAVAEQEASDAPFVYFYSYDDSAFIIQRADGTDRRILTEYTPLYRPSPERWGGNIYGPGWSPSGQWFVWMSDGYSEAFLVNRDGSIRRSIAKGFKVHNMWWNPVSDLLVIELSENEYYDDEGFVQIRLYDPAKDEVIAKIDFEMQPIDLYWSPDNRAFAYAGESYIYIFTREGNPLFSVPTRLSHDDGPRGIPFWLNTEEIAYYNVNINKLVIQNVYTGNPTHVIEMPEPPIDHIVWSPDRQYALILGHTPSEQAPPNVYRLKLWLASLADDSLTRIEDRLDWTNSPYYELSMLWNANHEVLLTSNADGEKFTDDDDKLAIYSASAMEVTSAPYVSVKSPRWIGDDIVFVGESIDEANVSHLYRYSSADGRVTILDDTNVGYSYYISPPQGDRLIYRDTILDMSSGERRKIFSSLSEELAHLPFNTWHVVWHPTEDWVIGGGGDSVWGPLSIHVADVAGTTETHLNWCNNFDAVSCYGWLPPEISTD